MRFVLALMLLGALAEGSFGRTKGVTSAATPAPTWVNASVAVAASETLHVVRASPIAASSARDAIVLVTGPVGSAYSMRLVSADLVRRGHAVWIIDPLGMGASSRPRDADYSLSGQARRLSAALDSLLPPSVTVNLVAQGTSATIALHLAASDTARIRGVVSLAGGVVDKQGTSGVRLALALAPLLDNPLGRSIGRRRFTASAREQSASPAWVTSEAVAAYLAPLERDLKGTLRTLKAMQDAVERAPIESRLPLVTVPVRLLVGDKPLPNAPTASQLRTMQLGLRHFTVDTLHPAGTMLHEEQAPKVAQIIDDLARATRQRRSPPP
jgi:pimeloyl-ACP methyl ester carboxylesterase